MQLSSNLAYCAKKKEKGVALKQFGSNNRITYRNIVGAFKNFHGHNCYIK